MPILGERDVALHNKTRYKANTGSYISLRELQDKSDLQHWNQFRKRIATEKWDQILNQSHHSDDDGSAKSNRSISYNSSSEDPKGTSGN